MPSPPITRRQREVLDHLSERAAFSSEKAAMTASGSDAGVADHLAARGVINKRYDSDRGEVYWIRAEDEVATGLNLLTGFVVLLNRNVTTPSGRSENFFLARARYDGKGTTFRRLLRGWLSALGLRNKDLIGGTWGFEQILADSPVFGGDHLILDETSVSHPSHARVRRSLAERIAHAEAEAARHLGNHNEHREAGREKAAERSFWAAQHWLDRANELRGQGS